MRATAARCGKHPVVVADTAMAWGYVANRVYFAMIAEAQKVVHEGIATADEVDQLMMDCYRWPSGPFGMVKGAGSGWSWSVAPRARAAPGQNQVAAWGSRAAANIMSARASAAGSAASRRPARASVLGRTPPRTTAPSSAASRTRSGSASVAAAPRAVGSAVDRERALGGIELRGTDPGPAAVERAVDAVGAGGEQRGGVDRPQPQEVTHVGDAGVHGRR